MKKEIIRVQVCFQSGSKLSVGTLLNSGGSFENGKYGDFGNLSKLHFISVSHFPHPVDVDFCSH